MCTAKVKNQIAVNVYPQVIVTGKVKYLIKTVDFTVPTDIKFNIGTHTKSKVFGLFVGASSIIKREETISGRRLW